MEYIAKKIDKVREIAEMAAFGDSESPADKIGFKEIIRLPKGLQLLKIFQTIKDCLPENITSQENLKKFFYDHSLLPFDPEKYNFEGLIGSGGVSLVYHLENKNDQEQSWVIKILRRRYLDKNFTTNHEAAVFLKQELEEVKSWYGQELDHIFLKQYILESKGVKGEDAVVILQSYLGKEMKDIFSEVSMTEWPDIFRTSPELARDFLLFIDKTLEHHQETGETLDFLGKKNICLVSETDEQGKKPKTKLLIPDPFNIHSTKSGDDVAELLFGNLEHLKEIKKIIEDL